MLSITGRKYKLCDGISRRDVLRIGALAMGGLALPDLLRLEAQAGITRSHKAIIMIYMAGAPSHQDMYDLKMDAPTEIRGEYRPIETSVPGIQICDHMPGLAKIMDKCVPLRSVYGSPSGAHDSFICYTGRTTQNQPAGNWSSVGSTVSQLKGPVNRAVPPFVGLAPNAGHPPYGSPGHPGFLGISHAAFRPSGPAKKDMLLNGVTLDRLGDRQKLLKNFDQFRRQAGAVKGLDDVTSQALSILTSSKLAEALDLSKEDPATLAKYDTTGIFKMDELTRYFDMRRATNLLGHQMLLARRLCEAGCGFVTVSDCGWDYHANNNSPKQMAGIWPMGNQVDHAVAAFIRDLHDRGLQDDILLVVTGEMGRTPRGNKHAGRDHWPQCGFSLLFGGGIKRGCVLGKTDAQAGYPTDRPVSAGDMVATIYQQLGIDPAMTVPDLSSRPVPIAHGGEPVHEIIA